MATPTYIAGNSPMLQGWRAFVSVTLTNPNGSTGSNFQQLVSIDSNTYANLGTATINNVLWADAALTPIDSWLESGETNTSTATLYWILLASGIGASSSATVNLVYDLRFSNQKDGVVTGAEPEYTGTYGQYDNGANMFVAYDNFAGTSISASWSVDQAPTNVSVNNGLTIGTGGQSTINYKTSYAMDAYIFEFNVPSMTPSSSNVAGFVLNTDYPTNGPYTVQGFLSTGTAAGQMYNGVNIGWTDVPSLFIQNGVTNSFSAETEVTAGNPTGIIGMTGYGTNTYVIYNYTQAGLGSNLPDITKPYFIGAVNGNNNGGVSWGIVLQYFRIRKQPPNNTMPTVTTGNLQLYPVMAA